MVGTIYGLTPGRKFSRLRLDNRRVKYVLLQVRQRIDTAFIFSVENRETRAELERKSRLGRRKGGGVGGDWNTLRQNTTIKLLLH